MKDEQAPLKVVHNPEGWEPWMGSVLASDSASPEDFDHEKEWVEGGVWEVGLTGNQMERLGGLGIEFLPELIKLASGGVVTVKEPSFQALERVGKQKTWGYQLGGVVQMSETPDLEKDTPVVVKQLFELVKKVGIKVNFGVLADQESPTGVRFEAGTSMPVDLIIKGLWAMFGKEFVKSMAEDNGWDIGEPKSWQEGVNFALQQALTKGNGIEIVPNWRIKLDKASIPRVPTASGPDGIQVSLKSEFPKGDNWNDLLQKNVKAEQVGDNMLYQLEIDESKWFKENGLSDIGVVLDTDKILSEMRPKKDDNKLSKIKAHYRKNLTDWFDNDKNVIINSWKRRGEDDTKTDVEILADYYTKHPIEDETLEQDLSEWLNGAGKGLSDRTAIHEFLVERGVVDDQIDECIDFITGESSFIKRDLEEMERDEKMMAKGADLVEKVLSYTDISRDLVPKLVRSIVNSGLNGHDLTQIHLLGDNKIKIRIR